jgi:hypothetical protein
MIHEKLQVSTPLIGISKVISIHKPRPMLHNFPPLPPNYDGTILIEMPGRNVDIAALSWLTVLLQLVVWARTGTPAQGLFVGFLGLLKGHTVPRC